ncbi:hypothetical protein O9929_00415 [Vibrio lentus]|nr:hypothetical protein [Vibrio lentus]
MAKIQLSASQLYWLKGEAFDNLLIDLDLKRVTAPYGASFDWRGAKISGQAEQYKHDWSLVNITIDGLRLNEKQTQSLLSKKWDGAVFQMSAPHQQFRYLAQRCGMEKWPLSWLRCFIRKCSVTVSAVAATTNHLFPKQEGVTIDDDLFVDPVFS